jgi:hypothetical protein
VSSVYPGAIDSLRTDHQNNVNELLDAADINKLASAAMNIETELDRVKRSVSAATQSGTTYTLALADAGTVIELSNASAVTVTVPPNSSVAFPTGTLIGLLQYGAGQVTVAPGSGVTLRSPGAQLKSAQQYSTIWLRKRGTNEWVVSGDVSA